MNHVGRIEPPPQAHLEHDGVDPAAGEVQQPHRRGDLEEGRAPMPELAIVQLEPLDRGADLVDQLDQLVRRDRAAVDAVSLFQPMQVGRAVQPRADVRPRSSAAAMIAAVEPFPLVPATWITLSPRCGSPSRRSSRLIRRSRSSAGNPGHSHPFVVQPAVEVVEPILVVVEHGIQPSTAAWAERGATASTGSIRTLGSSSLRSMCCSEKSTNTFNPKLSRLEARSKSIENSIP